MTFVVALHVSLSSAQQSLSDIVCNFVVWLYDGTKISLPFDSHPVVTYNNNILFLNSANGCIEYPCEKVRKFTIEEVEVLPDMPTPDPDPEPTPDPEPIPEFYFVVWMHSGARISFSLSVHPLFTYSDDNIVVVTSQEQISYPHSLVRKFTITNEDISQDDFAEVKGSIHSAQWKKQGDVMAFSDCVPGEEVLIYNASGQLMERYVIASDGRLQISLQPFDAGMYVVKMQSITYKFIKK